MIQYVLCFAFTENNDIVLIRKSTACKCKAVKGLLNAPGGVIFTGEKFEDSAIRKFREECGLETTLWSYFGIITDFEYQLHCLRLKGYLSKAQKKAIKFHNAEPGSFYTYHKIPWNEASICRDLEFLIPIAYLDTGFMRLDLTELRLRYPKMKPHALGIYDGKECEIISWPWRESGKNLIKIRTMPGDSSTMIEVTCSEVSVI